MKKFERFLDDYSWLLKSVIVSLLILWAMQGHYIVKSVYDDVKNQPPRNSEIEAKMAKEVNALIAELVEKAKANKTYGPKDYFADYRTIETKKNEFNYYYDPAFYLIRIGELQCISMQNVGKDKLYNDSDISRAAKSFSEWKKRGGPIGDEWDKKIEKLSAKERFDITYRWVSKSYLRGFFLAIFLFLIRMVNRRGIIETILADKKKFFLAIIFWPFFLLKYPFNVIREIIVEVEIRRLGNLFRRLTEKERELVRKVASSKGFWQWITEFQKANELAFQRAFIVVLIPTILMYFFAPKIIEAKEYKSTRDGPVISTYISQEKTISFCDDNSNENQLIFWALFEEKYSSEPLDVSMVSKRIREEIKIKNICKKIEHIPIFGRSFVSLREVQFNTN